MSIHGELIRIRENGDRLVALLEQVVVLLQPEVTGIMPRPGVPTDRPSTESERTMAKPKISMATKSSAKARAPRAGGAAAGPMQDFLLLDNQDNTFTVQGTDAAGATVDISTVATLTPAPTSSDPTVLTVDTPTGMTGTVHALKPGSAKVTINATWTDGSVGPFTIDWPLTVSGSAATGLTIVPGTPTVRP